MSAVKAPQGGKRRKRRGARWSAQMTFLILSDFNVRCSTFKAWFYKPIRLSGMNPDDVKKGRTRPMSVNHY
jgi:hypothetical protein